MSPKEAEYLEKYKAVCDKQHAVKSAIDNLQSLWAALTEEERAWLPAPDTIR